jgi:hypothetical protein
MTALDLLAKKRPEDLFPGELAGAKARYLSLVERWHPDRGGDGAVMAHVNALYREAVRRIEAGAWAGRGLARFESRTGERWELRYLASRSFELGRTYVGDTHLTYVVEKEHRALSENAEAFTGIFSYATDAMREEMARLLPRDVQIVRLADGRQLMRVPKTPDLLSLRDVLDHLGGKLDPRHVAWIGSGMHHLACYLRWAGLVHMDVSPDAVFVSPSLHRVALLGGWWFATKEGRRIASLPARTHDFLPWSVRGSKRATFAIDLETIRATLRELLGDLGGSPLQGPDELVRWLSLPATGEPVDAYRGWYAALERTFGKRKFVELKLDAADLYPGGRTWAADDSTPATGIGTCGLGT